MNRLTRARRQYERAQKTLREAQDEVKGAAIEAHHQGKTLRAIGSDLGLSYARVYQLTKEE